MTGRKARVLHVIDSLDLGGAQEVVLNLATFGNREDFEHEVATLHGRGIYWSRLSERGIPLHSLSPKKWLPVYFPALAGLLARGGFDVLHCHLTASNLIAKPMGALAGVRAILNHDHANDPARSENRCRAAMERQANRFAHHVIAVSASCHSYLTGPGGLPAGRVSLILNAIDTEKFSPQPGGAGESRRLLGLPESAPVVAGVGRLNPQKNFRLFLEVAARVLERVPGAWFVLAGEGPEEAMLRGQAENLGVGGRLVFAGCVPDTRVVYRAADVLLMPSRFEGLPMTLLEAMAMEVPVVASRVDGIAEVVEDGGDGFLVSPNDGESFAGRIVRLLEDKGIARETAIRARRKICEKYSAERMAREVEAIYGRLLK